MKSPEPDTWLLLCVSLACAALVVYIVFIVAH